MPIPRMLGLGFSSRAPTSSAVTGASFSSIWSRYAVSNSVSFYFPLSHSFLCNVDGNRKVAREGASLSSDPRLVLLLRHPMLVGSLSLLFHPYRRSYLTHEA